MRLRKRTVFLPCSRHAATYASETRYRRAEVMVEGGWASSPCADGHPCRMRPGTDFYTADFVQANPTYTVGPDHNEYTVVACYREPPSMWCETVLAPDPASAIDVAWEACKEGNGWDDEYANPEDDWTDVMVIVGDVKVAPDNYWSWIEDRKRVTA